MYHVTPSRVCELKLLSAVLMWITAWSHPHGCVSWNYRLVVWIVFYPCVTPSRVCELKWIDYQVSYWWRLSHPHGCVSWNLAYPTMTIKALSSHPHGCVSWNCIFIKTGNKVIVSHPHGCVSWNRSNPYHAKGFQSHPHGCVSWNYIKGADIGLGVAVTPSRVCELKYLIWRLYWRIH